MKLFVHLLGFWWQKYFSSTYRTAVLLSKKHVPDQIKKRAYTGDYQKKKYFPTELLHWFHFSFA